MEQKIITANVIILQLVMWLQPKEEEQLTAFVY